MWGCPFVLIFLTHYRCYLLTPTSQAFEKLDISRKKNDWQDRSNRFQAVRAKIHLSVKHVKRRKRFTRIISRSPISHPRCSAMLVGLDTGWCISGFRNHWLIPKAKTWHVSESYLHICVSDLHQTQHVGVCLTSTARCKPTCAAQWRGRSRCCRSAANPNAKILWSKYCKQFESYAWPAGLEFATWANARLSRQMQACHVVATKAMARDFDSPL